MANVAAGRFRDSNPQPSDPYQTLCATPPSCGGVGDVYPIEVEGRFLGAGLIHMTRKGILVRSKSEVIISDLLYSKSIAFQYEQALQGQGGSTRYPDFTITDDASGTTFYWEHLGMLGRPSYRRKWDEKLAWYEANGITPHDRGGGPNGTLLITEDGLDGSISSADIESLIDEVLR